MNEPASGTPLTAGRGSVIVLTGPPGAGKNRALSRPSHALTDPEPVRSLHRQFTNTSGFERHVLDSTQLTPQATADAILHGLTEEAYHLAP